MFGTTYTVARWRTAIAAGESPSRVSSRPSASHSAIDSPGRWRAISHTGRRAAADPDAVDVAAVEAAAEVLDARQR
jgi:hypothetical protein